MGHPRAISVLLLLGFEGFFQSVFQLYNLSMRGHPNRKGKKSWIFSLALSYFLTRACLVLAKMHFLVEMGFPTKGEFFLDELCHRNKICRHQTAVQKKSLQLQGELIEKKQGKF